MYQASQQTTAPAAFQAAGDRRTSKLMSLLSMLGSNSSAATPQQTQAFNAGAGPVSQAGAQQYLQNSFNSRVWDAYGSPYSGSPSIYDVLMRAQGGRY